MYLYFSQTSNTHSSKNGRITLTFCTSVWWIGQSGNAISGEYYIRIRGRGLGPGWPDPRFQPWVHLWPEGWVDPGLKPRGWSNLHTNQGLYSWVYFTDFITFVRSSGVQFRFRIGTGIGIPGIFRAYGIGMWIESKAKITLNQAYIFKGGIGIGIESKGFGPESELNRNWLLLELHNVQCTSLVHLTTKNIQQLVMNSEYSPRTSYISSAN